MPSLPRRLPAAPLRHDRQHQRRGQGAGPRRRRRGHAGLGRRADRRARPPRPRLAVAAWQSLSVADHAARRRRRRAPRSSALSRRSALGEALRCAVRAGACGFATNGRTTCSPTAASSPASCSNRRSATASAIDFVVIGAGTNLASQPERRRISRPPRWPSKDFPASLRSSCCKPIVRQFDSWAQTLARPKASRRSAAAWLARAAGHRGGDSRPAGARRRCSAGFSISTRTARCCSTHGGRAAAASPPAKYSRLRLPG